MGLADELTQCNAGLGPFAQRTILPVVVAAGGDLERFTQGPHGQVRPGLLLRAGRRCGRPLAFAGKPGAQTFAKMSLSIWTWRSLRRNSTSSWRSAALSGPCGLLLLTNGAAAGVPIGLRRTHLATVVACRPNSLAKSLALRPACTNSMSCWRNSGAYAVRYLLISDAFGLNHTVSVKEGQLHNRVLTAEQREKFGRFAGNKSVRVGLILALLLKASPTNADRTAVGTTDPIRQVAFVSSDGLTRRYFPLADRYGRFWE